MSLIEKRIVHGEPFYELKDIDMSDLHGLTSVLCREAYCDNRHDCSHQNAVKERFEETGIYTPILGCKNYSHISGDFLIDFDAKFNDDSFSMDDNN